MEKSKGGMPERLKQTVRNRIIKAYAARYPETTLAEIGRMFHITRQRVSIILKGEQK